MSPGAGHRRQGLRHALPGLLLLMIIGLDVVNGGQNVLGPSAMVPMLAATLLGPRVTAAYGFVTVAAAALLGYDDLRESTATRNAQLTRLSLLAVAGVIAVLAARARRRHEVQLQAVQRVAEVAQRAILPTVPDRIGPLRLAAHYESAAAEASIGGDLYAAVATPYGVRLLIGDVRGKGLDAVRLASVVLGVFRERAHERPDLSTLVCDLDAAVARETGAEDFVTALVMEVADDGTLRIQSAGHPLPIVAGSEPLAAPETPGPPLGLGRYGTAMRPQVGPVRLAPGTRLLLFTDGLTEARRRRDRRFFPAESVVPELLGQGALGPALEAVRGAVLAWTGPHLGDDIALLAVEIAPSLPPPAAACRAGAA